MKKFVCKVCGYVYEGENPPEACPQCKAPASSFSEATESAAYATEHVVGIAKSPRLTSATHLKRRSTRPSSPSFWAKSLRIPPRRTCSCALTPREALAPASSSWQSWPRRRTWTPSTTRFTRWPRTRRGMARASRACSRDISKKRPKGQGLWVKYQGQGLS